MGGGGGGVGGIIKKVADVGSDLAFNPSREVFRTIGLDGAVDMIDGVHKFTDGLNHQGVDLVSGQAKKDKRAMEHKRDEAAAAQGRQIAAANQAESARQFAESEKERMGAGAGSRTLLTGASGLEDSTEDDGYSLSRKTLRGV